VKDELHKIENVSDIILTSVNSVHVLAESSRQALQVLFETKRIAVVGEKTARSLQALQIEPAIIAAPASQQGLVDAYRALPVPASVLMFRAEEGADTLQQYFLEQQVPFELVKVYRMRLPEYTDVQLKQVRGSLARDEVDAVLLGSPKTAEHYLHLMANISLANRPILVAISQQVACTARDIGLNVRVIAEETSFHGMLDALQIYLNLEAQR